MFYFVSISRFMSDEDRVSMVLSPKTMTETETRGFQDQDSEVPRPTPRPRLRGPRPRPKPWLVKTGLETKTQVSRTPNLKLKPKAKASDSYIARLTGTKPDQPRFTIIRSGSWKYLNSNTVAVYWRAAVTVVLRRRQNINDNRYLTSGDETCV